MKLSEWVRYLKIIVSYLNAFQRSSYTKEVLRLIKMIDFMDFQQFLYPASKFLFNMTTVTIRAGVEPLSRAHLHGCFSVRLTWLATTKSITCQQWTLVFNHFLGWPNNQYCTTSIKEGTRIFPHWNRHVFCLLIYLPYLYLIFLPETPPMDLWYGLLTIMTFCITLILVKKRLHKKKIREQQKAPTHGIYWSYQQLPPSTEGKAYLRLRVPVWGKISQTFERMGVYLLGHWIYFNHWPKWSLSLLYLEGIGLGIKVEVGVISVTIKIVLFLFTFFKLIF